ERHEDADKPLLLGQHREDEIVVGNGEKPQLALRPLLEALSAYSTRPDGDARLDLLVPSPLRILSRIEKGRDSGFLVVLQREPPRNRRREKGPQHQHAEDAKAQPG